MSGACEKCLKISENGIPVMKCSCGHETPYDTAKMLFWVIYEAGVRRIKNELAKMIRDTVTASGILSGTEVLSVPLDVDEAALLDDIRFDATKALKTEAILMVGTKVVEKLIQEKRKYLKNCVGKEVDPIVVAKVIAFLYDGASGKHAATTVQTISNLGLEHFYLGGNVAAQNKTSLVYMPPVATSIFCAMGDAELRCERYCGHILTFVSKASYPLGIIVRTNDTCSLRREEEIDMAGLFIFI